jgi:hypothetical protein
MALKRTFGNPRPSGRLEMSSSALEHRRMSRRALAVPLFLVLVGTSAASCGRSAPKPTIVLDSWWMTDYAKNACESAKSWSRDGATPEMIRLLDACRSDPTPEERDFEGRLAARFAADPQCSGINFVIANDPSDGGKRRETVGDALQKQHWFLIIDFTPGDMKQRWDMKQSSSDGGLGNGAPTKGEGDPTEVANTACSIVKGRGATLLNKG